MEGLRDHGTRRQTPAMEHLSAIHEPTFRRPWEAPRESRLASILREGGVRRGEARQRWPRVLSEIEGDRRPGRKESAKAERDQVRDKLSNPARRELNEARFDRGARGQSRRRWHDEQYLGHGESFGTTAPVER